MTDIGTLETTAVFGALIAVILGIRTYRMLTGTVVSVARLVGFAVLFVGLFVLVVAEGYALLPWYASAASGGVLLLTAVGSVPFVQRRVRVDRRPDGTWVYRVGVLVPAVYLTLFLVRLGIDAVVLNESFAAPPTISSLSPGAQLAVGIVDVLFAFSTGLLVARSVAVYRQYRAALAAGSPPRPNG